jgi:hypothetical protein
MSCEDFHILLRSHWRRSIEKLNGFTPESALTWTSWVQIPCHVAVYSRRDRDLCNVIILTTLLAWLPIKPRHTLSSIFSAVYGVMASGSQVLLMVRSVEAPPASLKPLHADAEFECTGFTCGVSSPLNCEPDKAEGAGSKKPQPLPHHAASSEQCEPY